MHAREHEGRFFTETIACSSDMVSDVLRVVSEPLQDYEYDHFRRYPAKEKDGWRRYALWRLLRMLQSQEWIFFCEIYGDLPCLLGCRLSPWDRDHFGFGMANLDATYVYGDRPDLVRKILDRCLSVIRARGVRFVSARIPGDNIFLLHVLESMGFRYYENIIWPVASCRDVPNEPSKGVRPMQEADLARVTYIAANYQYKRGHYHCDNGFDTNKVDAMYAKWVTTAWVNKEPISVIEYKGEIVGYFVFCMQEDLSNALGFRYAGMRSLGLDARVRGMGLGSQLFLGTMSLMKQMGSEFTDSGYASKNHASAKLHSQQGFFSVYEEVTLHLWL